MFRKYQIFKLTIVLHYKIKLLSLVILHFLFARNLIFIFYHLKFDECLLHLDIKRRSVCYSNLNILILVYTFFFL